MSLCCLVRPCVALHFCRWLQVCSTLDDWIIMCVGRAKAEQLAQLGVRTVEGLEHDRKLLQRIKDAGCFFDEEELTIKLIDPT